MSQANVESVERFADAYDRRDVDALGELVTEDFEWVTTNAGAIGGGSFRGRAGIEAYFPDVGSGVSLTTQMWSVSDFRDGKCWRCSVFLDRGEALRAAALAEEDG
jgi:hypothetical protein